MVLSRKRRDHSECNAIYLITGRKRDRRETQSFCTRKVTQMLSLSSHPIDKKQLTEKNHRLLEQFFNYISIGNSMICSVIWHKYHKWYFEIAIRNLRQFWNIVSCTHAKYHVQIMLFMCYYLFILLLWLDLSFLVFCSETARKRLLRRLNLVTLCFI